MSRDTMSIEEWRVLRNEKDTGKPKRKHDKKESRMQKACVRYFRIKYPLFKNLLFAIPNGGSRNLLEAANMKEEGVISGVPDLFLAISKQGYNGFFLEAKVKPNKLSRNQEDMIKHLKKQGYKVEVFWSYDEFVELIDNYLK